MRRGLGFRRREKQRQAWMRRSERRRTAVGKDDLKRLLENLRREIEEGARPFKELLEWVRRGEVKLPPRGLEEAAAKIVEENPEETYTEEEMTDMVDAAWEEQEIVPCGTLTTSHMEAIARLEEWLRKPESRNTRMRM